MQYLYEYRVGIMKRDGWTEDDLRAAKARMGKVGGSVDSIRAEAVSIPAPPPQKREYDSKWEETYATELVMRKHAGLIKAYWYHPWTFRLPGGVRLEIDFLIEHPLGLERKLQIMEIKGWHKNIREAMAKLKIAAAIWPCFQWTIGRREKGGGWSEEDI